MLRKPLIVAGAIAAALLLAGCGQSATLLEQDGGPMTSTAATWTFTAPGAWDLHWSYSDCPDSLVWVDDFGASANPIQMHDRGDAVAVFTQIPPLLQYQAGLRGAAGVEHFDQGGPVRLQVHSRCRWQLRAIAV
jgi:hypothetical protein